MLIKAIANFVIQIHHHQKEELLLGNPTPMRQKIASISQKLGLPSVCALCSHYHRDPYAICQACSLFLKRIDFSCQHCALPLVDANFLVCGQCAKQKPSVDNTYTTYHFEEPLRTVIHQFKYQGALYLRTFLVKLMLDAMTDPLNRSQCLIPVPLHPKRLRQRGFNQAAALAKLLAKTLAIPCELNLCRKIIHTEPQVNLSGKQRHQNLRQAFAVKKSDYQHITLIDDLITTGSTANELAKAFKAQGVARVDLWCCARAAGGS